MPSIFRNSQKRIFHIGITAVILVAIILLQRALHDHPRIIELTEATGYTGVALFTFINSFNFFVPIVTPTLVPTWVAGGLEFGITLGIIIGVISVVDIAGFLLGKYSHGIIAERAEHLRVVQKITALRERNSVLPLIGLALWIAFAPLPNELMTIPFGILGYRALPVCSIILVGNIVYNSAVAFATLTTVS